MLQLVRTCLVSLGTIALFFLAVCPVFATAFTQEPTRILIPSAEIDLPVVSAEVGFNTWQTSTTMASYGSGTTPPGLIGNTVLFAHARLGLFGSLYKVQVGDLIHVFTSLDWFVYRVEEVRTVVPEDISIISPQQKLELTLFTCTGPNDAHRLVVKAVLVANTY